MFHSVLSVHPAPHLPLVTRKGGRRESGNRTFCVSLLASTQRQVTLRTEPPSLIPHFPSQRRERGQAKASPHRTTWQVDQREPGAERPPCRLRRLGNAWSSSRDCLALTMSLIIRASSLRKNSLSSTPRLLPFTLQ